jgi:hypothetical protein
VVGIGFITIFFLLCVSMLVFGNQTPEEKKLWIGGLVSLGSGFLGFMVGKKS